MSDIDKIIFQLNELSEIINGRISFHFYSYNYDIRYINRFKWIDHIFTSRNDKIISGGVTLFNKVALLSQKLSNKKDYVALVKLNEKIRDLINNFRGTSKDFEWFKIEIVIPTYLTILNMIPQEHHTPKLNKKLRIVSHI